MSLLDDIRKEQASDGTSMDTKYVRRMEAALLAADELAKVCAALIDHERPETEAMKALAAYRTAIGDV